MRKDIEEPPDPSIRPVQASALSGDARDFVRKPRTFASKLGIPLEALACPPEAHAALNRATELATAVEREGLELSEDGIQRLRELVADRFGRSFEASFIPFGLQFRERMRIDPRLGITATGTVSVTWADTDADVDG